jgi:hypothetical protein
MRKDRRVSIGKAQGSFDRLSMRITNPPAARMAIVMP